MRVDVCVRCLLCVQQEEGQDLPPPPSRRCPCTKRRLIERYAHHMRRVAIYTERSAPSSLSSLSVHQASSDRTVHTPYETGCDLYGNNHTRLRSTSIRGFFFFEGSCKYSEDDNPSYKARQAHTCPYMFVIPVMRVLRLYTYPVRLGNELYRDV